MRLGATLAAAALSGETEPSVDGLVLWDPCVSGRAYLRAQRALHAFSLEEGATDDGSVEAPGVVYSPETVEELSSLSLESVEGPLAGRILVLRRESQSQGRRAFERFASARPVELGVAEGQEDLVDVKPDAAKVPFSSVAAVGTWLRETSCRRAGGRLHPAPGRGRRGKRRRGPDRRTHPFARTPRSLRDPDGARRRRGTTRATRARRPSSSMPGASTTPVPPGST